MIVERKLYSIKIDEKNIPTLGQNYKNQVFFLNCQTAKVNTWIGTEKQPAF